MKRLKTYHELSLMKVACMQDVECLSCRSKFKVNVTMEGSAKWALYQNPNAVKIRTNFPNLKKFLKIRPDAFAFVNQNIDKTICPCCNTKSLIISDDGEYNRKTLLESLDA